MSNAHSPQHRAIGIYPTVTGFAFGVVERSVRLVDWGQIKFGVNSNCECRSRIEEVINGLNRPTILVLEDFRDSRRGERARTRVSIASRVAAKAKLPTALVTGTKLRSALGLASRATKDEIALDIIRRFPELRRRMPRTTAWQRDPRMFVFEAVALALSVCVAEPTLAQSA